MRHALLLAFVHGLLLGKTRRALALEGAVVAGVLEHRLLFDMNDFIHHRVEEVAVVGDQNQSALIALEPLLQPNNRIEIEVVSRFIEQQQVRAADQRLRQVEAHTPAAGEVADRAFQLFIAEAQAVQQAGGAGANGPRVDGVQLAVNGGDGVAVVALVCGIEFRFELTVLTIAVDNIVECRFAQGWRLLVHPGELPVPREGAVTAIRANLVFQQRQQRGFTTAVFADQAHFLARVDGSSGVIQQDAHAATNL